MFNDSLDDRSSSAAFPRSGFRDVRVQSAVSPDLDATLVQTFQHSSQIYTNSPKSSGPFKYTELRSTGRDALTSLAWRRNNLVPTFAFA